MNRRFFLKSTVSLAIAGAVATRSTCSAAQAATNGGYYRLFPSLHAAQFEAGDLMRLANGEGPDLPGMSAKPELLLDNKKQPLRNGKGELIISATPETEIDDEENYGIPAGYTYLGQFVDHDLTFKADDAFAVKGDSGSNNRTARFDLDSLYGAGPYFQPFL